MAQIGLKNLYYATLAADTADTATTYGAMKKITGAISADIKPASNSATLYADDGPFDTATTLGEITVTLEMADLPLSVQAEILGHTLDKGVMVYKATDKAPYVAIAFESEKSNGGTRYVKLLKGKFQELEESTKTKDDKVDFQTPKISGKFVCRTFDGAWKRTADTDAEGFVATTGTDWYKTMEPTTV